MRQVQKSLSCRKQAAVQAVLLREEIDITDFELWADGRIIGPKTSVIDEMRGVIIPRTAVQDMHVLP